MEIEDTWQLVIDSPMGAQHVRVIFRENSGALTGTLMNNANNVTAEIFDGSVHGDELQWKVKLQQMKLTLAFTTTVSGDTMTGKVKAGLFGKFTVSGEREG